jgi:uncharacterized protein with ATP-grasp and redox domains
MKTFFDCIPCFVRQSLDSVRMTTPDEAVHERLLREVLRALAEMDMRQSPPAMAKRIHRITAVRLAIAGNVIDMGVNHNLSDEHVHEGIDHALDAPFEADMAAFGEATSNASNILYLADNAGEIVFDRLP